MSPKKGQAWSTSQWCHNDITMMSQWCHNDVTTSPKKCQAWFTSQWCHNDVTITSPHHQRTSTSRHISMTSQCHTQWRQVITQESPDALQKVWVSKETPSVCMMSQWCHHFGCVTDFWNDISKKVRDSKRKSEVSKETPNVHMTSQWHHHLEGFQPISEWHHTESPTVQKKLQNSIRNSKFLRLRQSERASTLWIP